MATIRIPNIDEDGRFLDPKVLDRLAERFGAGGGGTSAGITANTTLDEAAAAENGA